MRKLFAQAFSLLMQLKRIVVALTLVSTTSCTDTPLAYQTTSELSTNLQKFSHRGPQNSLQLLNEATNFIWDTVYYFGEGTPKAIINQTTSLAVFEDTDGRYTERGALLVFKREDQLVQALAMLPPLYVSGTNRKAYGYDEAELIAHTQNPGPYLLRFVDR